MIAMEERIASKEDRLADLLTALAAPESHEDFEAKIDDLEDFLFSLIEDGSEDCPHAYRHIRAGGVYYRELFIPAGGVVIGKRHKTEHVNILMAGRLTAFTADGPARFEAPCPFVAGAGVRKVVWAQTNVLFANAHADPDTSETIEQMEARLVEDSPRLIEHEKRKELKS